MLTNKKNIYYLFAIVFATLLFYSCQNSVEHETPTNNNTDPYSLVGDENFLTGYEPLFSDGDINVVIEIPTGTNQKWEVEKETGNMVWEIEDGIPRVVKYLGYPGNYGMVPRTLLPKSHGGDGDPLDVIVLGSQVVRGSVLKCKLIGVLKLLDGGEQDDKLIAIHSESAMNEVNSLEELNTNFTGVTKIIELWFTNYKGEGVMESIGFGDKEEAEAILNTAIDAF